MEGGVAVKRRILCCAAIAAALLLTGCSMRTVDEMYQLPKRSQEYSNLQTVELNLRGQEPQSVHLGENPWYYEVQDIDRLITEGNYDACYTALETTLKVVDVLEKARKFAKLSF